jgi:hypothetical protein
MVVVRAQHTPIVATHEANYTLTKQGSSSRLSTGVIVITLQQLPTSLKKKTTKQDRAMAALRSSSWLMENKQVLA